MLFNSEIFIFLFLPMTLLGYWLLKAQPNLRLAWLLAASYLFYAYWDARFTPLILLSTSIDFIAGQQIHSATAQAIKRRWLFVSILMNLGLLGFFKYYNFFADSVNDAAGDGLAPTLNIVLPIGISFFTFQSMSYTIDIYREKLAPTRNFLQFAVYVVMFPQLIAGPIVRYSEIAAQFADLKQKNHRINWDAGVFFFVIGLGKKVIIADQIGVMVNTLLIEPESVGFFGAWVVAIGYTYQLYFDFSGYSDMAVGLGYLLGFKFPQNFDNPYAARNISDFWRRWHITLSNWLRDYLFISLGGSHGTRWTTLRNLLITMFLGGLWHGAAWTFVIWGLYHGVLLVIFHAWRLNNRPSWNNFLARGSTFLAVIIGWVMFRADSVDIALSLYESMLGLNGFEALSTVASFRGLNVYMMLILGFAFISTNLKIDTWDLPVSRSLPAALGLALIFITSIMLLSQATTFLYFQF